MNEHVDELLSAYIDDELSESEFQIVKNHLAVCDRCEDELQALRNMKDGLALYYSSIEIPDFQFENAVLAKINNLNLKSSLYYKWVVGLPTLFLTIMIAICLFAFGDIVFVGVTVISEIVKIAVSLSHAFVSILSSIPFLLEVFAITTIIIVGLSVWSVRYLLRTKTVE
ncbi:zf-HC2 domain-containing protein [Bacillus sp. FJAT-49736]|uniref:anti-sigma factor family protein n=1 Tax=Bacillus sp. FJAT-49736 TaxID=2833582 RepID=UPI001BC9BAC4|nr:zf-HC2 domain-containing protein [Bacillus sp. FJAT-49736]MBS4174080.1 zf-HC2 domain-containing protein [Bacillus sp. FJAT-49736]